MFHVEATSIDVFYLHSVEDCNWWINTGQFVAQTLKITDIIDIIPVVRSVLTNFISPL